MAKDDWFRGTRWNEADREAFHLHLARSRGSSSKAQYARIQASYLQGTGKRELIAAAEELLDHVIAEWPEPTQLAQTYLQKAECAQALRTVDEAIVWLRKALEYERQYPNARTQAYLQFGRLVVLTGRRALYAEAVEVLREHAGDVLFPVDRYYYSGLQAIVASDQGEDEEAHELASLALQAARETESGFRYHPTLGLVEETEDALRRRLTQLAGG